VERHSWEQIQQSQKQLLDRQKGLLPHLWRSGVKSQVERQVHLRVRTLPTPPLVLEAPASVPGNIKICLDWHDTLDQALNSEGSFDQYLIDKFKRIVLAANNRVEFHILSHAGFNKIESTRRCANHLIYQLKSQGLPFEHLHLAKHPCGAQGKSSVLHQLGAHSLVDDRSDIVAECSHSGARCFGAAGRHDRDLSYLTLVEEWVKQEGVESILKRRAAKAVPKEHLRPPFGDRQWKS